MSSQRLAARADGGTVRAPNDVSQDRLAAMTLAVELEVDAAEFGLRSLAERRLWAELIAEFEDRVEREGRFWIAG